METRAEVQKKEIATIQKRDISLNLSTADVGRLATKAASAGLTIPELLENYIGDLVSGTYSNGSDERDFANRYFERCGFEYMARKSFLRYIIWNEGSVDYVMVNWDTYECAKEVLNDDDPEITPQEREYAKEDMDGALSELLEYYTQYQAWAGSEAESLESGVENVINWQRSLRELMYPSKRQIDSEVTAPQIYQDEEEQDM